MKMINIPYFKRLAKKTQLDQYGKAYFKCSGLPVPNEYLHNPANRVYAVYFRRQMIGGFILGKGQALRTLEVFAQTDARTGLYNSIGNVESFTEITCFWIGSQFRRNTSLNTFIWLSLAFLLRRFANEKILFGTCSTSLARLYGITPKSKLIHRDEVNGKRTFIFQSERRVSLQGFLEILRYKWARQARIRRKRLPAVLRRAA